jgi:hypothetical protein
VSTGRLASLCALLAAGCGYGATVQERGFPRRSETLRILNRQMRVYDCEGVPAGKRTCQYLRFQVALDEPEATPAEPAMDAPAAAATTKSAAPEGAEVQMVQQALQGPGRAPESPSMSKICPEAPTEVLQLSYEVLKYPSSEVARHADRLDRARSTPVDARLQQRPFASRVGIWRIRPRWSVDSEQVKASEVQTPRPDSTSLEVCDGKRVANLDLVLLDEDIAWHSTGDLYQLEVWRQGDRPHRTVESLNTVAQWGTGSLLAGVALIGAYIFFGFTR